MIPIPGTHSHLFGKPRTKCMGCGGLTVLAYCDACAGLKDVPSGLDDRRRNGEPTRLFPAVARPGTTGGIGGRP